MPKKDSAHKFITKQSTFILTPSVLLFVIFLWITLTIPSPVQAEGCEKWKSEIARTAINIVTYGKALHKYEKTLDRDRFVSESAEITNKLFLTKSRVESVPSCYDQNSKFERRHDKLLFVLNGALKAISALVMIPEDVIISIHDLKTEE